MKEPKEGIEDNEPLEVNDFYNEFNCYEELEYNYIIIYSNKDEDKKI